MNSSGHKRVLFAPNSDESLLKLRRAPVAICGARATQHCDRDAPVMSEHCFLFCVLCVRPHSAKRNAITCWNRTLDENNRCAASSRPEAVELFLSDFCVGG